MNKNNNNKNNKKFNFNFNFNFNLKKILFVVGGIVLLIVIILLFMTFRNNANKYTLELIGAEKIDENRLAMETVIYADKSSVEEEITRLNSHICQFRDLIKKDVVGKKLDFLIQEMNRETNTIGSKSASIEITNLVVEIKTQIEDIREQIQNIE